MSECIASEHSECDPDSCFVAKCRYWRENGLSVHWQGAGAKGTGAERRKFFHESTIPERQRKIVADAAARGREVRPVNPLYDRNG